MLAEARDRFSGVPINMYEDVPHAAAAVGQSEHVRDVLAKRGTRLVRVAEDVTDVFEQKLRAISVYGSQFKLSYMEPRIRELAEREAGIAGKLAEVYYRVEGNLHLPSEAELSRDWVGLTALGAGIRAVLLKRPRRRRVTVIILPSSHFGIWTTDSESLSAAFSGTDLRVFAPQNMAWQAAELENTKLVLEFVRDGARGWVGVTCRELFSFRNPTIVLWRGAYGIGRMRTLKRLINMLIRFLLPFRPVLFARTLRDLSCILDEQLGTIRPVDPRIRTSKAAAHSDPA
jgi:hypothetical protein